jgi:hypothetical protein
LSFPGLTGESRETLDARLKPAGMTGKHEWTFKMCQFNNETFNKAFTQEQNVAFCNSKG